MLSSGVRRERVIAVLSSIMTHNRGYQKKTGARCVAGEGPPLTDWLTPVSSLQCARTPWEALAGLQTRHITHIALPAEDMGNVVK